MELIEQGNHKKREGVRRKKYWKIGLFLLLLMGLGIWETITALVHPTLIALCKVKSQSLATTVSSQVVQEVMSELGYLDLVTLDRDNNGNILALRANVIEMNKLSAQINHLIQERYSDLEELYIKIPIGNFTGNDLLARKRTENSG